MYILAFDTLHRLFECYAKLSYKYLINHWNYNSYANVSSGGFEFRHTVGISMKHFRFSVEKEKYMDSSV